MKTERVSDIRRSLEPSAELKRRVMERAAGLEAGSKTIGSERTTTDNTEISKENNSMSIHRTSNEVPRLKSRIPAAVAAACAALVIGGVALHLNGAEIEAITDSETPVPAAQAETADSGDITQSETEQAVTSVEESAPDNIIEGTFVRIETEPADSEDITQSESVTDIIVTSADERSEYETATVPKLVGMSRERAIYELKEAGLGYELSEISSDAAEGTVVEQSIPAGEKMEKGAVVIVYVSESSDVTPKEVSVAIPLPDSLKGTYVIDLYLEGAVVYTKTIENAETLSADSAWIDVMNIGRQKYMVYIKRVDTDLDNYIRYAAIEVDFDAGSFELTDEPNTADLLKISSMEKDS